MKTVTSTTFTLLSLLLSGATWAVAEEKPSVSQVEMVTLKIRILETNAGAVPRVLASPLIMTVTGREVSFRSAGKVKSKFDESTHDIGTQITATIDALGEKKFRLKFEATLSNATLPEQDSETECFMEQKLTARTVVESGKMKKLHVSPDRWYELTVGDPKLMHFDRGNGLGPQPPSDSSATKDSNPDHNFRYVEKPTNYVER